MKRILRKGLKVLLWLFLLLFLVITGVLIALQFPSVQSAIADKAVKALNDEFGTSIQVESVETDFFGNVLLNQVTAQDQNDYTFIKIKQVEAQMSLWDVVQNSSHISIDKLILRQADIDVITYKGEETDNFTWFTEKFDDGEESTKPSGFKMSGDVEIVNSSLSIVNQNLPENEQSWLDATNLNIEVDDFNLNGNIYTADLEKLTFQTKHNGETYHIKNMQADYYMDDNQMKFDNLKFETEDTQLDADFVMNYHSFHTFSYFNDSVQMNIQLKEINTLGYKDLRYFVPDWNKNHQVELTGNVQGNVNDLFFQDFSLSGNQVVLKTENLSLQNSVSGNPQIFTNQVSVKATYKDLKELLPDYIAAELVEELAQLGQMEYNGKFQLFNNNLVAKGKTKTDLGNADVDLKLYDYSANAPQYEGKISTENIKLAKLLGDDTVDNLGGTFTVSGKGFDLDQMNMQAQGTINHIDLAGERLNHITLNGTLSNQRYEGLIAINDANVNGTYNGVIDFSNPKIQLDFNSEIQHINLTHFRFFEAKNSYLKANITGAGSFSDIEDFEGSVQLTDIILNRDTINLQLPQANLKVFTDNLKEKHLEADVPGYITANVYGKYRLEDVPNLLLNGVDNFLVKKNPLPVKKGQYFTYSILLEENLLSYLDPDLYMEPGTFLSGYVNQDNQEFELDLTSPFVQYKTYKSDSLHLYLSTSMEKSFAINTKKIELGNFPLTQFSVQGKSIQDTILASSHFWVGENNFGEVDLNFYQTLDDEERPKLGISQSSLNLEDRQWTINSDNKTDENYAILDILNNYYYINNLTLESEDQFLKVNGEYRSITDFMVEADLNNIQLEKTIPKSVLGDLNLKGIVNGKVDVTKNLNELTPVAEVAVDSIYLENYYVGDLTMNGEYDEKENEFAITGSLDRYNINSMFVTGAINNSGEKPQLDLVANLDQFNMNFLDVFLSDVLNQWTGSVAGDLTLKGNVDNPEVNGDLITTDVGFKVVSLGTKYKMKGENEISISKMPDSKGYLSLAEVEVTETSTTTKGVVDGWLVFNDLSEWFVALNIITDKLLVMNTTIKDNELMYGRVFGQGEVALFGPATDMEIYSEKINVLGGSEISLNTGGTKSVSEKRFIQFYARDENNQIIENKEKVQPLEGVTLDLTLNVDEKSTVNLVIDEQTDDKIIGYGTAEDFQIKMDKTGSLEIDGEYKLGGGTYNFRQSGLINKDFIIKKGGYVLFSGNPYNAALDVEAIYSRHVSNVGTYVGIGYVQPTQVDVLFLVKGNLEKLDIDFAIDLPRADAGIQSQLDTKLSTNVDERIKQAASILAYGSFDTSQSNLYTVSNVGTSSLIEILGKQVGNLLSNVVDNLVITPTYVKASQGTQQSDRVGGDLVYRIGNRLTVSGAFAAPVESTYNEKVTAEGELEYDISKKNDNGLVLRFFTRPTTLGIENFGNNSTLAQSTGGGIVFRKSFDSFSELFGKNKNKPDNKEEEDENVEDNKAIINKEEQIENDSIPTQTQ